MAIRPTVKFYYDILSPYSWLAFEVLCRYQKPWDMDLQLKPMNLGKIMAESGNRPPGMNPFKASLMSRDVQRAADMVKIPYKPLENFAESVFIRGSVPTLKALAACQQNYPTILEEFTRQCWIGLYSKDVDITDADNIREFAIRAGVPDVDKLLDLSKDPEARQQLIDNTTEALDAKCFGAPWYTTVNPGNGNTEKFFGQDRVEMLAWVLGKEYKGVDPS